MSTNKIRAALLIVCASAVVSAQQVRDGGAPRISGTGSIAGQVVTDETSPRGIRRAIVTLGGDALGGRSAITDDNGRFVFVNLPSGNFTVSATKAAYLPAAYGARRPGRPGTAVVLAEGARQDVTIRMARGAVIAGTIRDASGAPMSGVDVTAVKANNTDRPSASASASETATADDRGMYRIYGLLPGEYQVRATLPVFQIGGTGPVGARSTTEMDALLAALGRRSSGQSAGLAAPASQPPLPIARAVGFLPTYFPGTPIQGDAETITLAAGEERAGIDFELRPSPAGAIAGSVSGPVANAAAIQLSIYQVGSTGTNSGGTNPSLAERPTAQSGGFRYTNVTPGKYRIIARADQAGEFLYAVAEVDMSGGDIGGVALALQPGSTFAGNVTFDAASAPVPSDLSTIRVSLTMGGGSFSSISGGTVVGNSFQAGAFAMARADGSFAIRNIAPGAYNVIVGFPGSTSGTWWLRSVVAGGRDLLDGPVDVATGFNVANAQITFTDKRTELSGTLQAPGGLPAPEYFVVAFPADKTLWRAARRIKSTRPSSDGRYSLRDLPGGEYLLAALTDVEPADLADAKFLEQVAPAALRVTLAAGETKTQDLRLSAASTVR
jgi:hypothetical protein